MELTESPWKICVPSLREVDARIECLETELEKARELRQGIALILAATAASQPAVDDEQSEPPPANAPKSARAATTLRALVVEYLRTHERFTGRELVDDIQAQHPDAKAHTLRALLSHAKTHGEAEMIGNKMWRSLLHGVNTKGAVS